MFDLYLADQFFNVLEKQISNRLGTIIILTAPTSQICLVIGGAVTTNSKVLHVGKTWSLMPKILHVSGESKAIKMLFLTCHTKFGVNGKATTH